MNQGHCNDLLDQSRKGVNPEKNLELTQEGELTTHVNGTVNVMTGRCAGRDIDYVLTGPVPFVFERYHDDKEHSNCGGWHILHDHTALLGQNGTSLQVLATDSTGDQFAYFSKQPCAVQTPLPIARSHFDKGLVNSATGEIGGSTNKKNQYACVSSFEELYLQESDGTKRIYKPETPITTGWSGLYAHPFELCEIIKPSGHRIIIERSKTASTNVVTLKATNPSKDKVFGSATLQIQNMQAGKSALVELSTSDCKRVYYNYKQLKKDSFVIEEANGREGCDITYEYHQKKGSLARKILPNSASFETFYYCEKDYLPPICPFQKADKGYKPSNDGGKVFIQRAPVGFDATPVITQRFCYYQLTHKHREDAGYTDVFDAYDNRVRYYFNKNRRVYAIDRHLSSGRLYHSENMIWEENSKSVHYTNLNCRFWKNEMGQIVCARLFEYDEAGNVIKESFCGNLSGKFQATPKNANDLEQFKGNVERFTKAFTYSKDDFHLKLTESIKEGAVKHFTYLSGTNLPKSELLIIDGKVHERCFYEYDSDHLLTSKIIDDGSSQECSDLTNVYERRISRIIPRKSNPGMGLPEVLEELYYDKSSGREILLSRKINCYHQNNKIMEQTICDGNGDVRYILHITYDDKGHISSETDPFGNISTYSYDACGNKIREDLPRGVYREYTYDLVNRLLSTREVHPDGTFLTTKNGYNYLSQKVLEEDSFGAQQNFEYDCFGNLLKAASSEIALEDGSLQAPIVTKKYDSFGNVVEEVGPCGYVTQISYNTTGNPTHILYPDGTQKFYEYNFCGTLKSVTLKNGSKVYYEYDAKDREIKKTVFDRSGKQLITTSREYNAFHIISETDAAGVITKYVYDGAGRVIKISKEGRVTTFEYDDLNEVCRKTIGESNTDFITYVTIRDLLGQVIEEQVESSQGLLKRLMYTYDSYGNKIESTTFGKAPQVEKTRYDTLNMPVEIIDAAGNATHIFYDRNYINSHGQRVLQVTTRDPIGVCTLVTYDRNGKISSTEVKNAAGERISYKEVYYDLSGNVSCVIVDVFEGTDFKSSFVSQFKFGPMNRKEKEVIASGTEDAQTTSFEYDREGRLIRRINQVGVAINYEYDARGRISRLFSDGDDLAAPTDYLYVYNEQDLPLQVIDKITKTVTTRAYNVHGQVTQEVLANDQVLKYSYDHLGRCIELILPDSSSIKTTYVGEYPQTITRLDPNKNIRYQHMYKERDLSGRITCMQTPSGTVNFGWSLYGNISSIDSEHYKKCVDLFDLCGNVLKTTTSDTGGRFSTNYLYDEFYQLVEERSSQVICYSFDSIHNRISVNDKKYVHNALNQVVEAEKCVYSYDFSGNRVQDARGVYSYDALNRLIKFVKSCGEEHSYTYDGFNRRISKDQEHYLYAGNNEIGSLDDSGVIKELRILGEGLGAEIGASIALEIGDRIFIPIHDTQGSLALLLDLDTSAPLESYRYTAFGKFFVYDETGCEKEHSSYSIPWLFSSKRQDHESGLIYFGRRYFDPQVGTWLTMDPKGFGDGVNLYAYVHNNPLTFIDLYGLTTAGVHRHDPRYEYASHKMHTSHQKEQEVISPKENVNYLGKSIDYARSTLGRFVHVLGHELPIPYVRLGIKALGNAIEHGSFLPPDGSPLQDISKTHEVGTEPSPGKIYAFQNGIGNTFKEARATALEISRAHRNAVVHMIYNSSHGFILDFFECIANVVGIPTHAEQVTRDGLKELTQRAISESAHVIHYTHSQGGLLTSLGLKHLSSEEREHIHVRSFGSAHMIPNDQAASVVNHVNSLDPVAWIGDFPGMLRAHFGYGVHLHVHGSWIPADHGILSASYQSIWQNYGAYFTESGY